MSGSLWASVKAVHCSSYIGWDPSSNTFTRVTGLHTVLHLWKKLVRTKEHPPSNLYDILGSCFVVYRLRLQQCKVITESREKKAQKEISSHFFCRINRFFVYTSLTHITKCFKEKASDFKSFPYGTKWKLHFDQSLWLLSFISCRSEDAELKLHLPEWESP